MPKLIPKIFRSERRSSSPSAVPYPKPRASGIFRRKDLSNKKKSSQHEDHPTPFIQPAITLTFSEEDEVDDFVDVESQLHVATGHTEDVASIGTAPKETEVGTSNDDLSPRSRTMTFTHLEIMRHELCHQMQLAEKERNIHFLKQQNEELKVAHELILTTKEQEISKLKRALAEVETVLSKSQEDLEVANEEQSKIIGVLMETQVQLHEEIHKSWISPWLSYFELN